MKRSVKKPRENHRSPEPGDCGAESKRGKLGWFFEERKSTIHPGRSGVDIRRYISTEPLDYLTPRFYK